MFTNMKSMKDNLKTFQEEPYLGVLFFCFISTVIFVIIENFSQIASIGGAMLGGVLVILITTVLPITIGAFVIKKVYELMKRK